MIVGTRLDMKMRIILSIKSLPGEVLLLGLSEIDIPGLKVENAITRPDGLGTGNVHRGGNASQKTIFDNRTQLPSYCKSKLIS
jgi:hypothetical protein